jgi:dienelactone hydrolase
MAAQGRTPEEIRRSIEATREELVYSVKDLTGKVSELTNWRLQLRRNRQTALVVAGVSGFVIGGGIAAVIGLFTSD